MNPIQALTNAINAILATVSWNNKSGQITGPIMEGVLLSISLAIGAWVVLYFAPITSLNNIEGVPLDSYFQSGDADYTAAMNRAVAAGLPISLGSKTYVINDFSTGAISSFTLHGIPGASIIQRTHASSGTFFAIQATNVSIEGVTFDMNSGSVSANQWPVFMSHGGQNVSIHHSTFKNNSGSFGSCLALTSTGPSAGGSFDISDNEITNCTFNSLYLGSVAHGVVSRNYIHDVTSYGIWAGAASAASSTNYLTDVIIDSNRVLRSSLVGINVGGYAPPYSFVITPASHVLISNNTLQDNLQYGISVEADYISVVHNHINQSAGSVSVLGGIDTLSRFTIIEDNVVALQNVNFGIDCGGSVAATVRNNLVSMNQGAAINSGGNLNSVYSGNHLILTGTAIGITNYALEGSNGNIFPTVASGTSFIDNTFDMFGGSTGGIESFDNAGGYPNTSPMKIFGNHFNGDSGVSPGQAIIWYGNAASLLISGNDFNGRTTQFADPITGNDVVFDNVFFGGTVQGISSTNPVRAIVTSLIETYGGGGSILYVTPSAGGSGYTSATVLSASSPCSGWTGVPQIIGGVIVGVKTTAFGSSCTGAPTVTASDTGGGTGATFTVGNAPQLPNGSRINYFSTQTHLLQRAAGVITLNYPLSIQMSSTTVVQLQTVFGGLFWSVIDYTIPSFVSGSLPSCGSTAAGAQILITGGASGKWSAQCNGTNWLYPDGSTASYLLRRDLGGPANDNRPAFVDVAA